MAKLGTKGLAEIANAIATLDPEHRFVQLDVHNQAVTYADEFLLNQSIHAYEGEEEGQVPIVL